MFPTFRSFILASGSSFNINLLPWKLSQNLCGVFTTRFVKEIHVGGNLACNDEFPYYDPRVFSLRFKQYCECVGWCTPIRTLECSILGEFPNIVLMPFLPYFNFEIKIKNLN